MEILRGGSSYSKRGAPLTEKEKKELNIRGRDILRKTGVRYGGGDYDTLRRKEYGWAGFASLYVYGCWDETDLVNKADVNIYKKLITIDDKMGTQMTEQLFWCVWFSYRMDLFKV